MRHQKQTYAIIFFLFLTVPVISQETVTITEEKKTTIQLPDDYTKTLGLYIFPTKNQDNIQQEQDLKECYKWAYEQTKYDPLNPTRIEVNKAEREKGGAVKGAVRGAASGAVIGAVAGDTGDGAAIGAVAGAIRGRRASRIAQNQENEKNAKTSKTLEAEMKTNFVNAFSACIKAKDYSVN